MLNGALLIILAAAAPATAAPGYLEISRSPAESFRFFPGWRVEAPFPERLEIYADLGESIEGQVLTVGGAGSSIDDYRVQTRYETSITIMEEGPHLDLVHWKHYRSEWREASRVGPSRFKLPVLTEEQATMFPEVTIREIQDAVLAAGGERWADMVRNITGPRDYPAAVGLSSIQVRIQRREGNAWNTLTTVIVYTPMGC